MDKDIGMFSNLGDSKAQEMRTSNSSFFIGSLGSQKNQLFNHRNKNLKAGELFKKLVSRNALN